MIPIELTQHDSRDGRCAFGADQRLADCDDTYRRLYGLPDDLREPGTPLHEIVRHVVERETGFANRETIASAQQAIARQLAQLALGKWAAYKHFLADGRVILVRLRTRQGGGWVEVHEDITAKSRMETQTLHLRASKPHNPAIADEGLREALARTARGEKFALLFLEFDAYEAVNDSFGRPIDDADLRKALAAGEFELKFQPILNLSSSEIVSSEALIRWRKPDAGLVLPGEFIPLAVSTGLILPIGAWVLKEACMTATTWPDGVSVAINVSASQLAQPRFRDAVVDALDDAGLAPARLELELSELTMLSGNAPTLNALSDLRGIGVRFALEDFGAGYSSLDSLQRFPVDIIKIDPALVRSLGSDTHSREAFHAIASLAHILGASTTAKGVETQEQLDLAREIACDAAQGYFVCPPLPVEGADRGWRPGSSADDMTVPLGSAPLVA